MSKKRRFISLRVKSFLILAVGFCIAGLVFFGCREFGSFLVWRYYLNEENVQERADGCVKEFQQYVMENRLSIDDTAAISGWSAGRYVDILLYKDKDLIYAPEWFQGFEGTEETTGLESESTFAPEGESTSETAGMIGSEQESLSGSPLETVTERPAPETLGNNGWFSGDRGFEQYLTEEARAQYQSVLDSLLDENRELSPIYFVDGTLLIRVVDYSEDFMDDLVNATALVIAVLFLAALTVFNLTSLVTRVNKLAYDVRLVESGSLEMPISLEGNDELTALADDVNSMRNAVVDNMTKERQAWEANAGLITAMSHDIRTPLTVLMGYLDLLELQNKDPEVSEYITACKENTGRLKRLSDDMFSYFLVFGKNGAELELSFETDSTCIGHMITEHAFLLSEKGYTVDYPREMPSLPVRIDTAYFGRVIDNIFSNITKYADPAAPVVISADSDGEKLQLRFENRIRAEGEQPESNRIGLKTCVRIMEQMGGTLAVSSCENSFETTLTLPVATSREPS